MYVSQAAHRGAEVLYGPTTTFCPLPDPGSGVDKMANACLGATSPASNQLPEAQVRAFESAAPEEEDKVNGGRKGTEEPMVATSMGEYELRGRIILMG